VQPAHLCPGALDGLAHAFGHVVHLASLAGASL